MVAETSTESPKTEGFLEWRFQPVTKATQTYTHKQDRLFGIERIRPLATVSHSSIYAGNKSATPYFEN
jgi:hypothetical protein